MRILFYAPMGKPEPWLDLIRSHLPEAEVEQWQPGAAPADIAIVWSPPQQLFDEQPKLKAVFNLGAGMDALLKLQLPPGALLVRLDSPGPRVSSPRASGLHGITPMPSAAHSGSISRSSSR